MATFRPLRGGADKCKEDQAVHVPDAHPAVTMEGDIDPAVVSPCGEGPLPASAPPTGSINSIHRAHAALVRDFVDAFVAGDG